MSFANLKQAILQEASREAEGITARLSKKASEEKARILAQAKQIEESAVTVAELEGKRLARRKRQEAELQYRAAVLEAKEEELHALEAACVQNLTEIADAAFYTSLLKHAAIKDVTIHPGAVHVDLVKKAAKGHTISDKAIAGEAGFIVRGKDTEINLTLSHLVRMVFKKHRAKIAARLFS